MEFRDPDVSAIAKVFADPARATMVLTLLDGERHQAGELAARARVTPSTASSHLRRLLNAGVVTVLRDGTKRTYAIADERVQRAIQALASIAPDSKVRRSSLTRSVRIRRLSYARKCYGHLGGALAMHIVHELQAAEAIKTVDGGFLLEPAAARLLKRLDVDASKALSGSPFVRACEDWTEGGSHFGGPLGEAIYRSLIDLRVIVADPRSRFVTPAADATRRISMKLKTVA